MKEFNDVVKGIDQIIEDYESGVYRPLNEYHRELSTLMYWLVKWQIEFNSQWNAAYHNFNEPTGKTSSASKERHADKEVPELYSCRKLWEAAKNVNISIGYEIKTE